MIYRIRGVFMVLKFLLILLILSKILSLISELDYVYGDSLLFALTIRFEISIGFGYNENSQSDPV